MKQLATRLEDRGFLKIERDHKNKRILRLKKQKNALNIGIKRTPEDVKSVTSLFRGLEDEEIKKLFQIMGKLEKTSHELYKEAKR